VLLAEAIASVYFIFFLLNHAHAVLYQI
jgi:hypothetical protein